MISRHMIESPGFAPRMPGGQKQQQIGYLLLFNILIMITPHKSEQKTNFFLPVEEKFSRKVDSENESNYEITYHFVQDKKYAHSNINCPRKSVHIRKLSGDHHHHSEMRSRKTSLAYRPNLGFNSELSETEGTQHLNQQKKQEFDSRKKIQKSFNEDLHELKKNKAYFLNTLLEYNSDSKDVEEMVRQSVNRSEKELCSSDIYVQEGGIWKNRSIITLTTKKIHSSLISSVAKVKARKEQPMSGYFNLKYTCGLSETHNLAIRQKDLPEWFYKVCWACLCEKGVRCSAAKEFSQQVEGQLLKKGQLFGGWEKRHVTICKNQGLVSSRSKDSKPSLAVKQTNEVWSRFELVQGEYLVVKFWYGPIKEEFGIPLSNAGEWLGGFASLIRRQ